MKNKYLKLIDNLIVIILLTIVGIRVSFHILKIKNALKQIFLIFVGINLPQSLKEFYINHLDKQLIVTFWIITILTLVYKLSYYIGISLKDKKMNNSLKNSRDEFTRCLLNYLESKEKRCYVITGEWGVGKTYNLRTFLKSYLKYSKKKKIYNISCFGISTRTELINEIKLTYEREDDRYVIRLSNFLKAIPILGDGIYNLIKPRYELKDMKKNAVFIFDDFERLTQSTILENHYNPSRSFGLNNSIKEINDINKSIDKLNDNLNELRRKDFDSTIQSLLQRYNIVAGLINELIEIYEMKVIVVCNIDKINPQFYFDIFNEKLAAIKFNIEGKIDSIERLIKEKTENIKSMPSDKKSEIINFFESNKKDIIILWKDTGYSNLRILSGILSAFIDIFDRVELNDILDIEKDVFYSIFIGQIAYYSNTIAELKNLKIGINLILNFKKYELSFQKGYGARNNNFKYLENKGLDNNVKWAGSDISLTWILGKVIDITKIKIDLRTLKNMDSTIENYLLKDNVEKKELLKKFSDATQIDLENLLYGFYLLENKKIEIQSEEVLNILKNTKIIFYEIPVSKNIDEEIEQIQISNQILNTMERYKFSTFIYNNEEIKNIIFTGIKNIFSDYNLQVIGSDDTTISNTFGTKNNNLIQLYKQWTEEEVKCKSL